ncbi:hypothetical protein LCGC14_0164080 [marine sediment metagenome]|uniref:Uncharacterized protein n=1 Tax=marine sediment metagenome TaxID=412755 RepID=A0A0F9UYI0_9ZZZZ
MTEDRNCRVWVSRGDLILLLAALAFLLLCTITIGLSSINNTLEQIRDRLPAPVVEKEKPGLTTTPSLATDWPR